MSSNSVEVEKLSKLYQLGEIRPKTLRESFERWWNKKSNGSKPESLWALKDISFSVKKGEIVGIIGKNGAGKSTLLKVLSKITEPTSGRAVMRGRVSSLLEVGTGFHPELTGRENTYLNGAVLGMRKKEIDRKFDEIVEFAEIAKFIETPVKHYSSGMYVRLAFAVAAHLEPDILIVDEVLAVGDSYFQQKCLGKISQVAHQGRTVLLVSHNMSSILRLCQETVFLKKGRLDSMGESSTIVEKYLREGAYDESGERSWEGLETNEHGFLPVALRIFDGQGRLTNYVKAREGFEIEWEYSMERDAPPGFRVGICVSTALGEIVFYSWEGDQGFDQWNQGRPKGRYTSRIHVPLNLLNEGNYSIGIIANQYHVKNLFYEEICMVIKVDGTGTVGSHWSEWRPGTIRPLLVWSLKKIA